MHRVELIGARILRVFRRLTPVHYELVVRIEFRNAGPAVAVGNEIGSVWQPGDVRRAIKRVRTTPSHAELSQCVDKLAVIGELIDDVQLVIDDPNVLLLIVWTDLDLMRSPAAGLLAKELLHVRPFVDQIAIPIDDKNRVLKSSFPAAQINLLAGRRKTVCVAC